jgi:predicted KAP-like P-loop ATPase
MERTKDTMTKKERFEVLKKVATSEVTLGADEAAEYVAFLDRQIELASKKRNGETKAQKANKELAEIVFDKVAEMGKPVSVTELFEALKSDERFTSAPKVTALLTALRKAERVVRTEEKGKAFYTVA